MTIFLFMYLPQTRGPYHKGNRITRAEKCLAVVHYRVGVSW